MTSNLAVSQEPFYTPLYDVEAYNYLMQFPPRDGQNQGSTMEEIYATFGRDLPPDYVPTTMDVDRNSVKRKADTVLEKETDEMKDYPPESE
jgi:hypothetical protein